MNNKPIPSIKALLGGTLSIGGVVLLCLIFQAYVIEPVTTPLSSSIDNSLHFALGFLVFIGFSLWMIIRGYNIIKREEVNRK